MKNYLLAVHGFDIEFFDKPNRNHTGYYRTANYIIHVK